MSGRDARTGPAREATSRRRGRAAAASSQEWSGNTRAAGRRTRGSVQPASAPAVDGLVIGPVPPSARVAGALLVLAGLAGAAAMAVKLFR